jgi:YHS domain-containing protein
MARFLLFFVLSIILSRMFWRIAASFMEGLTGVQRRPSAGPPQHGVHMVRDPVCGTFVVPDRAVVLHDGRAHVFFCSDACRDKYRARTA